jgi:hypothetical protein
MTKSDTAYDIRSVNRAGETSAAIRARVEAARRQRERFAHVDWVTCNSGYPPITGRVVDVLAGGAFASRSAPMKARTALRCGVLHASADRGQAQ